MRDDGTIAIVGMGCRFPGSPDLPAFWDTIRTGRVCAVPVPRDRWNHDIFWSPNGAREANRTYARKLAPVDDVRLFAPEFFGLTPRRAKVMDPQQRLFLETVRTALEDAGYARRDFPRARTGVYVGACVSDFMDILTARVRTWQTIDGDFGRGLVLPEELRQALNEDLAPMQAYSMVGSLNNMIAANVNQCFDLGGPSFTMDAACSSALVALHEAVCHLRLGLVDAAVVGGSYLQFTPDNMVAFARVGALSASDACRPYDGRADGFVVGEGVGAVLLRRLEDALAAGDRVHAVIRGVAANSDGKSEGPMTPRREGQLAVLRAAYEDARVRPQTLGYLEGHGTATPVGDATEVAAFRDLLASGRAGCALGSVKANIGHSLASAGIAGLIKATLCLVQRTLPPLAGHEVARPELGLDGAGLYIPAAPRDWANPGDHPRRAGVNAFGFGGTNVHVVLEEPPDGARRRVSVAVPAGVTAAPAPAAGPELIVLAAPTPALLRGYAGAVAEAIERLEPGVTLADLAFTLASRRTDTARLAVVATDLAELGAKLRAFAGGDAGAGVFTADAARDAQARRIAFLFPGQGLQSPGMGRDLYDRFPVFRAEFERLAGAADALLPRPLLSYLFPADGTPADEAARALTATEVCQPAVAALSLALARFSATLGLTPDLVLGHSLGEFSAAAAAGLIADDAEAVRFVARRGLLIARGTGGEPGVMTAVAADAPTVERAITGVEGAVVANLNHPRQTVISGTEAGVAEAERRLAGAGVKTTRLRVSHAFHSPLMAPIGEGLRPHVAGLPLGPPRAAVVSAIRPGTYPAGPDRVRDIFVEHATARVDFAAALAAAAAAGARVFVQLGAGGALAAMASACGAALGEGAVAMTLAGAAPDGGATFLSALGRLYCLGAELELRALHAGLPVRLVTMLPPSPLEARPLWPVARRTNHATPVAVAPVDAPGREPIEMESKPAKPQPSLPPAAAREESSGGAALAALFREQIAVLDAHLAIIRQQNELLARGGAPAAAAPPIAEPPLEALVPVLPPTPTIAHLGVGNGHGNGNGNGHAAKNGNGSAGSSVSVRDHRAPTAHLPPPPVALPPPAPEAPRPEPAPAGPSLAELEAKVVHVVSRITAHPPDRLKTTTRLGADLGFDSLMVVELVTGLQELVPDAEPLARTLFAEDISIADVARHLQRSAGAKSAARRASSSARAPRAEEVRRYAVAWEPAPLAVARPLRGAVHLLADAGGLAEALRMRLRRQGVEVALSHGADLPAGATVVDLRAAGPDAADAAVLSASAAGAFALARRLDERRPATLLFVQRGLAAAGLGGFAKALGREWTESRVLAVDVDPALADDDAAERIAAELAGAEATGEVRLRGGERLLPSLRPAPLAAAELPRGVVVAISGGATGLGGRLARELARRAGARLVLLGRRAQDDSVAALLADVRAAGGDAIYVGCDVRDPAAVAAALAEGRRAFGPIQAAAHAAGVVQDAPLAKKDAEGFARVFDTKVAGALALWRALEGDPLATLLLYGSWAGRFGNAHQVDYAAANHALARLAEALGAARPGVRVVALDLPPWEGSTMVAGLPEAVKGEMRARGVPFLSDETGLAHVVAELAAAGAPSGEALLGGPAVEQGRRALVRTRLAPDSHPYLEDHRIGDRPVLPMAVAAALLVEAARGSGALGGSTVTAIADLSVVEGVILADGTGEVVARASAEAAGGDVAAELVHLGGRPSLAYRARVAAASGWLEPIAPSRDTAAASLPLAEFYARHTFHGPRLRAVEEVTAVGAGQISGVIRSGDDADNTWLLAVDGALQLCAYWAVVHHGRIGLPVGVAELRLGAPIPTGARLVCRAALRRSEGDRFEGDLDLVTEAGEPVVQIRGLRAELVVGVDSPVVDPASYRIEEFPEVKELRTKIDFAKAAGIDIPYFRTLDACTGATALIDGREYLNFTSYNYVGLSGHPRIAVAVHEAVKRYGTSVSASRVTGGQKPLHSELEQELAQFLGCEASIVMVGGHATNVSVVGHIVGPEDLVLHDSLAHDSILGGARLAGAKRRPFPHNDVQALERILREVRASVRRVLIAVEGVYSMDGDLTPLPQIIELKKKYGAMLIVDEAHSLGVLGRGGRGVGEHYAVDRRDVDMWMGTMSKSLASCGGYIAGSAVLVEYLKYTTPGFIYSVGMTPANAAAALTALRILQEEPERARTCQERGRYFLRLCEERGIDTGPSEHSAVVPCIVGNSYACIRLGEALLKRGIHVHPIIYPAVAESMARLRFFITAQHTEEQLRYTADALAEEMATLQIPPKPRKTTVAADAAREGRPTA